MSLFRKKKKKTKPPIDDNMTMDDNQEFIKHDITMRKRDIYTNPGVDEVEYTEETVRRQQLVRITEYRCPNCGNLLFNTKLDGVHYYCSECKKQYDKKYLDK